MGNDQFDRDHLIETFHELPPETAKQPDQVAKPAILGVNINKSVMPQIVRRDAAMLIIGRTVEPDYIWLDEYFPAPGIGDPTRNWQQDYPHENGMYYNRCADCDNLFLGHKRRLVCRKCTEKISTFSRRKKAWLQFTELVAKLKISFKK